MADLTITAANVDSASGVIKRATAGATITQGQAIYLDTTPEAQLADCTTSSTTANCAGIALNSALANQPVTYITEGTLDIGATLTVGKIYVLSVAGAICPVDDLATSDWVTIIGYATATDSLTVDRAATGVQVP